MGIVSYRTPAELKAYVEASHGSPLSKSLPELPYDATFSLHRMGVFQALGATLILLMFLTGVVPAYYFVKHTEWYLIPLAVPVWMMSFTLTVLLAKWTIIRGYSEHKIQINSAGFLRWWFVDRAVHLWEFWVGNYFKDTLLLWLVYRMMGAKIQPSATLKATIQEFDLVKIGACVSINHQIRCRIFMPSEASEKATTPWFRKISISKKSVIRGMLSPGVSVGEGAYVEIRSV